MGSRHVRVDTVDINKRCDILKLDFENTKVQQKTNLEALNKAFDTIKIQNLTDRIKNCEEHNRASEYFSHMDGRTGGRLSLEINSNRREASATRVSQDLQLSLSIFRCRRKKSKL